MAGRSDWEAGPGEGRFRETGELDDTEKTKEDFTTEDTESAEKCQIEKEKLSDRSKWNTMNV